MRTPASNKWRYRKTNRRNNTVADDAGYPALAAAIVRQAIDDYRFADQVIKGQKDISPATFSNRLQRSAEQTKAEVIRFFRSQWYGTLCDIDPKIIFRKLGHRE